MAEQRVDSNKASNAGNRFRPICSICNGSERRFKAGRRVDRATCSKCRTTEIFHNESQSDAAADSSQYWEKNGTDAFNTALFARRVTQANQFLDKFKDQLDLGSLDAKYMVDYGCGLGAMVAAAQQTGLLIFGSDVSLPVEETAESQSWRNGRFIQLDHPWQQTDDRIQNAKCVFLLDVLEHHRTPSELIDGFKGADCFVIKVPNARGPLSVLASRMFNLSESLYGRLALVGDVAPHLWFFTSNGLDQLMARSGFSPVGGLKLVEVGAEAGARARSSVLGGLAFKTLSVPGATLALLALIWSDAVFRVYWRSSVPLATWDVGV